MDLGIQNKTAWVCGASSGLGLAVATALAQEGVTVWLLARNPERLQQAVNHLVAQGADAHAWAADVTDSEQQAHMLQNLPPPDILITNAGGPPSGNFRQWDRQDWHRAINVNMLTPIELMKATVDGMMERGFGRIINLTSSTVKAPVEGLSLSTGARSGLTGFVAELSRQTVAHGVTINNVLPGPFETNRLKSNLAQMAQRRHLSIEQARQERLKANPSGRFGQPDELGHLCAFLCSVWAGYITGQNILIDGGVYDGVF